MHTHVVAWKYNQLPGAILQDVVPHEDKHLICLRHEGRYISEGLQESVLEHAFSE